MKTSQLKLACLISMLLLSFACLQAQTTILVKGAVKDSHGETLPGVSVSEKGTTNGVFTDHEGKYTIYVSGTQSILNFSYVGHSPVEVQVGRKTTIDITFENTTVDLDDVVVIGYGSVKKKDLTGAVSTVSEKDFQKEVSSPDRMIVGKVAGVQITPNGGAPGSGSRIRIRGGASLNSSNDPLIIIDGIPLENSGVAGSPSLLSTINPNDIESMNILKDASATAIYGSRASNGVIIITTKQAKYGQDLKINFSTRSSLSTVSEKLDVLSSDQIRDIVNNPPPGYTGYDTSLGNTNTNWQDQIYQTAFGTDNNLSVSGAIKALPYRVSVGYLNEDGILRTGNMERFSTGINLNPRLLDNHLKIDVSLKGSHIKNRFANTDAIKSAVSFDPTQPVRAPGREQYDGYFTWMLPDGSPQPQTLTNPMLLLYANNNSSKVWRGIVSSQIDYKMHFLPELRANLNLGYDYADGEGSIFVPEWAPQMHARDGQYQEYRSKKENKLFEFYLNYLKEFDIIKSTVDFTAGYTYQDWLTHSYGFNDYKADGTTIVNSPRYEIDKPRNTLLSFFGRLNYTFMDKYLLTASLRRDGSSRFHKDNRWGTFPAIALAWKIKEENFLKDVKTISDLKLRVGMGKTGQQDIEAYNKNYSYMPIYQYSSAASQYQFGDQYYHMYRPMAYDKTIKWESTTTYNAAIDYGFLDNRISGSVDLYFKKTKDLLATIDVPAGANFSNKLMTNIGNIENKGLEVTLRAQPIMSQNWNWDFSFNLSYNKNKITKLTLVNSPDFQGNPAGWINGSTGGTVQIQSVGYSTYTFYLYKQVYGDDGKPLEGVYVDRNNDGKINSDDLYRSKSAEPKMTYGFTTNINYRRWTLNTTLRANTGNYMYNNMNSALARYSSIFNANKTVVNGPASVTNTNFVLMQPYSDYYLENASFLKMDNLSLTYDFGKVFRAIDIRGTLGVQNVFTITDYSGADPEIAGGVDRDFYPRPRTFTLGFNLSF